jgi:hypothetical protein
VILRTWHLFGWNFINQSCSHFATASKSSCFLELSNVSFFPLYIERLLLLRFGYSGMSLMYIIIIIIPRRTPDVPVFCQKSCFLKLRFVCGQKSSLRFVMICHVSSFYILDSGGELCRRLYQNPLWSYMCGCFCHYYVQVGVRVKWFGIYMIWYGG